MNLPNWFQWVVVFGPIVPVFLHLTGLDKTRIGSIIAASLPDVVGALKKAAAPPEPKA
jgi:hypothetical protein